MGGGENPTYSLIFLEMFLFLSMKRYWSSCRICGFALLFILCMTVMSIVVLIKQHALEEATPSSSRCFNVFYTEILVCHCNNLSLVSRVSRPIAFLLC